MKRRGQNEPAARMTFLTLRVPRDVLTQVDELARRYDRSRSATARRLLLRALRKESPPCDGGGGEVKNAV